MPRREERHDILFEPVRIGPKVLRNRFYQVPHCTGFGVAKPQTQALHRGTKAEGGWAAVCTEYCSISPETDDAPYISARLWDDEDARALALMVDEAHGHGALAGVELWHGGVLAAQGESRLAPLAPSARASEHDPTTLARAMRLEDIRRVQAEWVAAARRAADVGFDIVYVYGSHGYLPTQFLSPRFNRRTDAYGGSFENRARFWLETIEVVREAVGDRCAIAVRIAADGLETAGVDEEDGLAFIRAADHLVDLWDIAIGSVEGAARLDSGPSRFYRSGYQLDYAWTRRAREATAKPIVGVGRLTDPDQMAEIVRSGVWDVIGAARPSIADPFLPRKVEEGRYDEIRECIGCNACYARANWTLHLRLHARTRRRARSTGATGIPSASRRPRTGRRTCSSSAPARPAWSARSCSRNAASAACTSSTRSASSAARSATSSGSPASATGAACSTGGGSSSRRRGGRSRS